MLFVGFWVFCKSFKGIKEKYWRRVVNRVKHIIPVKWLLQVFSIWWLFRSYCQCWGLPWWTWCHYEALVLELLFHRFKFPSLFWLQYFPNYFVRKLLFILKEHYGNIPISPKENWYFQAQSSLGPNPPISLKPPVPTKSQKEGFRLGLTLTV